MDRKTIIPSEIFEPLLVKIISHWIEKLAMHDKLPDDKFWEQLYNEGHAIHLLVIINDAPHASLAYMNGWWGNILEANGYGKPRHEWRDADVAKIRRVVWEGAREAYTASTDERLNELDNQRGL